MEQIRSRSGLLGTEHFGPYRTLSDSKHFGPKTFIPKCPDTYNLQLRP